MNTHSTLAFMFLTTATLFGGGCKPSGSPTDGAPAEVVWVEEGIEHGGAKIDLGYRPAATSNDAIEPVAAITRDGQPIAGAMVFSRIVQVSGEGKETLGEEVATVYEPGDAGQTAIYAQAKLRRPAKNSPSSLRFRIVMPDAAEIWQHEIALP